MSIAACGQRDHAGALNLSTLDSPHPLIDLDWIRHACDAPGMSVVDCLREQDRVGPNVLFDVAHYRETYGSEIPNGMSCLEHFCRQERAWPRDPNPLFSVRQWHETLGWRLAAEASWKNALFTSMGMEARFALQEMERQRRREIILGDHVVGPAPRRGQEICLFVHFDQHNNVQPYVLDYLSALKDQGVCIVFLTNSHALSNYYVGLLSDYVWRIVCSDNRAYDWGLYATGVQLLGDLGVGGHPLILANDSVVGTMNSLSPLFAAAREEKYTITGALDSLLHDWHLQSFFIYCSPRAIASEAWSGFWSAYRPASDRWFVVNGQEMGFARWMVRHGVSIGAVWKYDDILKTAENGSASAWRAELIAKKQVTNPSIELWDIVLKAGCPFLKKSLFTTPLMAGNIAEICNVLSRKHSSCSYADKDCISNAL